MKNTIKIILAFILAALIGFGVVYLIKTQGNRSTGGKGVGAVGNPTPISPVDISDVSNSPDGTSSDLVEGTDLQIVPEPPVLVTSGTRVILSVGQNAYYYIVSGLKVKGNSNGIIYTLKDQFGHSYTSQNGSFPRVEANSAGSYTIIAKDSETDLSSEPKTIQGFNMVEPVANKLTSTELTEMIATGDYDKYSNKLDGRIAKKVSIHCTNSEYSRSTLAEVFMSVGLENWRVSVTSLNYNCLGQVSGINLSATK